MERYTAPGKQAFRDLLLSIARHDGLSTYGTLWGTGIDSRMFAAAGLDVLACEIDRAKHEAMRSDAEAFGYRAFARRASKMIEHRDMFYADFCGTPTPENFRELRQIASKVDRLLAVSLSTDHMRHPEMQGEAVYGTLPAWLTFATDFTLEYFGRYQRNERGLVMWTAVLRRAEGKGNWHPVQPVQIAYSIEERDYWASFRLYSTALLPHRQRPRNKREKAADHLRYQARRPERSTSACQVCGRIFIRLGGPQRYCSDGCRLPAQAAQRKRVHASWYLKKKAAVSGTAAEAV